jgi:antitoxin ParD1/3/4
MTMMNISLPDALQTFVDEQVRERGYDNSSEYVRELIRNDQERRQLRSLLLDGAGSESTQAVTSDYFEDLRKRMSKVAKPSGQA